MKNILTIFTAAWAGIVPVSLVGSQAYAETVNINSTLEAGFKNPTPDSRPETWFHLIGGNVSKPGLTADLEAIARSGVKGIQLFHGRGGVWPGVTPQINCLSPSWDEMIRHVADECQRLNLKFTMQNCPGWSQSGGPWIKPENAMRHLVWSRTNVIGGKDTVSNLPLAEKTQEDWRDYRDVAVIAFPTPVGDDNSDLVPTSVRSNRDKLDWKGLLAGKANASVKIMPDGEPAWVEVDFGKPVTLRSLDLPPIDKLSVRRAFDPGAILHVQAVSPNGLVEVARREIPRGNWQDDYTLTLAIPETTATAFRITFENKTQLDLTQLHLSSAARMDNWQGQSGYVLRSLDRSFEPKESPKSQLASKSIIDLSDKMDAQGKLNWQAPAGNWTVLRFGHVNTGKKNGPAPPEATGWECDKLSTVGADAHFAGYIGRISAPGGPADGGRLKGMVIDSWECHTQTWTSEMEAEFNKHRGYALRKWLPALAGWVVDDYVTTERFLRDWRATLNDLLVDNYYGRLASLGRERGMTLSFESGPGDVAIGDILQYYGKADIPMCEFWQPNDPHWAGLETKPMLPAVSAAHIYGKKRIAAESFTNIDLKWDEHPFMLKHLADYHFSLGLNQLVFHTYTHNPRVDLGPGTSFGGRIGETFLRGQTWWSSMPLFTDYIARCSFMLQQGHPVADVLWYLGDDLDHKPRSDEPFPAGYKYDYLNPDALLQRITFADGLLKTPEGIAWKVLLLPNTPRLTTASLTRIRDLAKQGATVVGLPSWQNASLSGGSESNQKFQSLLSDLWGEKPSDTGDKPFGAGRLLWGNDLGATLTKLNIKPDVTGTNAATWCHRQADGTDIYFIAADRKEPLNANLNFRSRGLPELWDPLTATSKAVSLFKHQGTEQTTIPIQLPAAGSVFVIFRPGKSDPALTKISRNGKTIMDATDVSHVDTGKPQSVQGLKHGEDVQPWVNNPLPDCELLDGGKKLLAWESGKYEIQKTDGTLVTATVTETTNNEITAPWTISFPPGWDAPSSMELLKLGPWSALEDPATRSFSGSATYSCSLDIPASGPNDRLLLDLGKVDVIAEVTVNDHLVQRLWAAPFRTDITSFVKAGKNRLEVKVTNTWFNRLAYDASLPVAQRKTWSLNPPKAGSALEDAGLVGPVRLRVGKFIQLK